MYPIIKRILQHKYTINYNRSIPKILFNLKQSKQILENHEFIQSK
jgi:hypothetical protein